MNLATMPHTDPPCAACEAIAREETRAKNALMPREVIAICGILLGAVLALGAVFAFVVVSYASTAKLAAELGETKVLLRDAERTATDATMEAAKCAMRLVPGVGSPEFGANARAGKVLP